MDKNLVNMTQIELKKKPILKVSEFNLFDCQWEKAFEELTLLAAKIFDVPIAAISIQDMERHCFKSSVGLEFNQAEQCISICSHTVEYKKTLIIEDVSQDSLFKLYPLVTGELGIRFYAGVPLITKDGFALGSFCLMDKVTRHFDKSQNELLNLFSDHVVAICELRKESFELQVLLTELEKSSRKIQKFANHLSGAQLIAKIGSWELDVNENIFFWSDEAYKIFKLEKTKTSDITIAKFISYIHKHDLSLFLEAYSNITSGKNDTLNVVHRIILDDGTESFIHLLGEVKRDVKSANLIIHGTLQDITVIKSDQKKSNHLSFYDTLTGLPNRQYLFNKLSKSLALIIKNTKRGALIYFDLDNFAVLNDTLGHEMGDLLIKHVATRLANIFTQVDTIARVGGDQFSILLSDLSNTTETATEQAKSIANDILKILQEPFLLNNHIYYITASIGIAMFSELTQNGEVLLKRAELAMLKAKSIGKNTVEFFNPEFQAQVSARAAILNDLRHALSNDQYKLFYQPQVDKNGRIVGCEALIRWLDPKIGIVSPADFIHIAEETGFIINIGQWVIEKACKQLSEWMLTNKSHLTISVNVSPKQFRQLDFVENILKILNKYNLDPSKLKMEITEGVLVENFLDINTKMNRLIENGITFSLDDFGTGYSSLNYLSKLPLDQLKIDQSFVKEMMSNSNNIAIAKTIIKLAHSLKLTVVAEGVETIEQQKFLAKLGCDYYQGNLYNQPLPIKDLNRIFNW